MVSRAALLLALEAIKLNVPAGYADSAYYSMGWEDAVDAVIEHVEEWEE